MSSNEWIAIAEKLGPEFAEYGARHDEDGTFAAEAFAALSEEGLFKALVPTELGGMGAGFRDICEFIRVLAHYDPSTALAYSMHSHLVAATVWKYRHGKPGEALLRKVVDQGLILVSTGAGDWLESNGKLEKVEGGYRYTSFKPFGSGSPAAHLMITSGRYEDPEEGPMVLHFPLAFSTEGVTRGSDWDAHGMRATGSDTVRIEGAFIPEESIALRRARGPWHPAFNVISTVALPIIMSAYVGVAERAAELAIARATKKRDDINVQYLTGELLNELFVARSVWERSIDNVAEYDFEPTNERASLGVQAKTMTAEACVRTVSKAMEVGGGEAFFRRVGIEKLMRDVRASHYHPLQPKRQHSFSGRVALGLPPVA
ncbi:MAG: acyl-CoA dehydrogenase family protein [Polyangiales bacterium]